MLKNEGATARREAAILNAGLINYVAGRDDNIAGGIARARHHLENGAGYQALVAWVTAQNREPERGLRRFKSLEG